MDLAGVYLSGNQRNRLRSKYLQHNSSNRAKEHLPIRQYRMLKTKSHEENINTFLHWHLDIDE